MIQDLSFIIALVIHFIFYFYFLDIKAKKNSMYN